MDWRQGQRSVRGLVERAWTPRDNDVSVMTQTKDKTHKASNVRIKTFIILLPHGARGG